MCLRQKRKDFSSGLKYSVSCERVRGTCHIQQSCRRFVYISLDACYTAKENRQVSSCVLFDFGRDRCNRLRRCPEIWADFD